MVHDEQTYLDDEGLEYERRPSRDAEPASTNAPPVSPEGRLWGAHESYGGYDAE